MKNILVLVFMCIIFSCNDKNENAKQVVSIHNVDVKTVISKKAVNKDSLYQNEILNIITAFKAKDDKTLNTYIDSVIGFYIIPGPGTVHHFENIKKVDFKNLYLQYHNFGNATTAKFHLIKTNSIPEYNCENLKWNRYGLFFIEKNPKVFTNILDNQILAGQQSDPDSKAAAARIDTITSVIYLTEKNSDIIFGIAENDGKLILTYLDLSKTYCDI